LLQIQPVFFRNGFQRIKQGLAAEADACLLVVFPENSLGFPVSGNDVQQGHFRGDMNVIFMSCHRHSLSPERFLLHGAS